MSTGTETLEAQAEIAKLARMLDRDPSQLAYLEAVALGDLRALREQTTEVLWSANSATLQRLAAASKLLPAGLTATIGQHAFGALLSARMAGLLDPERAHDVASRLPTPFLAEVAVELDPRRSSDVISRMSPDQIAAITAELVARREHVAMGRFVGHLSDEALTAALEKMDGATLLRVGFVLEDKTALDRLVGLLPAERLDEVIRAAAESDLWVQALDLLGHLSPRLGAEIVAGSSELDDQALEAAVAAVVEHELWEQALLIAERDPALQARLAERVPALAAPQRRAIARRARQDGTLGRLGPLGQALRG